MGGMKRKDSLLVKEDPLVETDEAISNEKEADSEFESDSDSESENVPLGEPSKTAIYNREGILEKLEDISWPENVEWIHKLTIDHNEEQSVDVNDDIVRELAFYTQALDGARQASAKLHSMGVPFFRPPDYYAEMVKTDAHMLKVKGKLLDEKRKIEEAEERKKAREAKKIAREVQALKLKERAKQKKEEIESVKKWRKQRRQTGFGAGKNEEMEFDFEGDKEFERSKKRKFGAAPGDRSGGIGKRGGKLTRGQERSKKNRDQRNSKFGYGGRKGLKKQNTAETTNDFRGFNKGDFSMNKRRKS
uniref:Putative rRNA-processing protein EBP2 n=1 Tax=Anthurium amnicola TaxID=1678845 RepID=A0A1D1Y3F6_9ARAE